MKTKLAEMIIYVAENSKTDPAFGMTKLYKILFASDFYNYGIKGEPISGVDYIHLPNGPGPNHADQIIRELVISGRVKLEERKYFGKTQKRIIPTTGSNMSKFTEDELEIIDALIDKLRPLNATDLSNWTHDLIPWMVTEDQEVIPYHTIFLMRDLKVEKVGVVWAKKELDIMRESGYAY